MARGDLLVKLFRSYRNEDSAGFLETANTIIDDERKKNHLPLATELSRTLNGAGMTKSFLPELKAPLTPLPKDSDRGVNLFDIRYPDRYFQDLVLSDMQIDPVQDLMEEFRQYEILEANGLRARMKMLFCGPPGCGKTGIISVLIDDTIARKTSSNFNFFHLIFPGNFKINIVF